MNHILENRAFAEGFQKGLVKCALNPRIAERVVIDPRRAAEFEALGRTIFNKSWKNPNPLSGILNTSMAGYGQLRGLHEHRSQFLDQVKALRSLISKYPDGHPARVGSGGQPGLDDALRELISGHHADLKQRLTEIGATSQPRLRFLRTTLPATGAGAAGIGAGYLGGNMIGQQQRENSAANATTLDRIKYLLNPEMVPTQYQSQPGDRVPSATDTGNV
jgi:hypothetical protein